MPSRRAVDPATTRAAMRTIEQWLRATGEPAELPVPAPDRTSISEAVRLTARTLAATAPGAAVELRVPPFVAVQCIAGPKHTRGTPPNIVETDARTWLQLVSGLLTVREAIADGTLRVSGSRAGEIADWLPLVPLGRPGR
jgi:hypothetical protein